jgi:hypothetical protein
VIFCGSVTATRKGIHLILEALSIRLPGKAKHRIPVAGRVALSCGARPGTPSSAALAGLTLLAAVRCVRRPMRRGRDGTHGLAQDRGPGYRKADRNDVRRSRRRDPHWGAGRGGPDRIVPLCLLVGEAPRGTTTPAIAVIHRRMNGIVASPLPAVPLFIMAGNLVNSTGKASLDRINAGADRQDGVGIPVTFGNNDRTLRLPFLCCPAPGDLDGFDNVFDGRSAGRE